MNIVYYKFKNYFFLVRCEQKEVLLKDLLRLEFLSAVSRNSNNSWSLLLRMIVSSESLIEMLLILRTRLTLECHSTVYMIANDASGVDVIGDELGN
jgi:hypothetical protein